MPLLWPEGEGLIKHTKIKLTFENLLFISNIQKSTSHIVCIKHTEINQQTTFSGSLMPGRYLTFSCSVLTISVSFLPSIISSYMYILTSVLNFSFLSTTFLPRILAIAEPLTKKKNFLLQNVFNLTFDGKYLLNFSLKHVFNRKQ